MQLRLNATAVSDIGAFRQTNQDAAFAADWGAAVADGVGGGPSGDIASAALVQRVGALGGRIANADAVTARISDANWDLRSLVDSDASLEGMATTFTGLFLSASGSLLLAHAGDSRGYLLRHGAFTRETRDDSYVQVLVEHGLLAPEDAAYHPRRNIITASLRGAETDAVTVAERDTQVGDRWLLCSDGLTDYVPEEEIAITLIRARDAASAASAIVSLALEAGTRDNVTAVVCDVGEAGLLPLKADACYFGSAASVQAPDAQIA
ncbi:protein phosphatase [Microbacterium endophyticum]|uniref:Protein phosphatase n=1 Tax=Microbacterium endophyticum TaxID=1526412 RepID=A0A7W4V4Q3_9MICO|nr:protein phosphatase 2C domain-containing protein [Microbacterium endophyticum]MBB2976816.1 protein phosphatase [Microbacterium endophyticum]NIK36547.1 protein phosphatase [Microbacterium endophyticum]